MTRLLHVPTFNVYVRRPISYQTTLEVHLVEFCTSVSFRHPIVLRVLVQSIHQHIILCFCHLWHLLAYVLSLCASLVLQLLTWTTCPARQWWRPDSWMPKQTPHSNRAHQQAEREHAQERGGGKEGSRSTPCSEQANKGCWEFSSKPMTISHMTISLLRLSDSSTHPLLMMWQEQRVELKLTNDKFPLEVSWIRCGPHIRHYDYGCVSQSWVWLVSIS